MIWCMIAHQPDQGAKLDGFVERSLSLRQDDEWRAIRVHSWVASNSNFGFGASRCVISGSHVNRLMIG